MSTLLLDYLDFVSFDEENENVRETSFFCIQC